MKERKKKEEGKERRKIYKGRKKESGRFGAEESVREWTESAHFYRFDIE